MKIFKNLFICDNKALTNYLATRFSIKSIRGKIPLILYIKFCNHIFCTKYLFYLYIQPTIAPISHASKVMLKILQTRLQQYVN